jgi:pimeloyl-ACP methyl ester carboxylesterase
MDLLSLITGSAQDFKLILDYLPAYLPQFTHFHNIMTGVSLGGHTAWRLASLLSPGQVSGFAIVVGCPSLSSLLLARLCIDCGTLGTTVDELDTVPYELLEKVMTEEQRRRWPRALAESVMEGDRKASAEEFPEGVPVLLCNGVEDRLVPARYTARWVERRLINNSGKDDVAYFVQKNTGHSCTKEMVAMIATWIGELFEA